MTASCSSRSERIVECSVISISAQSHSESGARSLHRTQEDIGGQAGSESVKGYGSQSRRTLCHSQCEPENFLGRRRSRDPGSLQVTVLFYSRHVQLHYFLQRKFGQILSCGTAGIVSGQPDMGQVEKQSAAGLV